MRVVFFLGAIVFLFTQSGEPLGVVLCCALNLKTKVSHTFQTHTHANKNGEKENLWQCEKEREGDERIHKKERGSALGGEIVVSSLEWIGIAS